MKRVADKGVQSAFNIPASIDYFAKKNGMRKDEVALIMGISTSLLYKRREDPKTFRYGELEAFADRVHIPIGWLDKPLVGIIEDLDKEHERR